MAKGNIKSAQFKSIRAKEHLDALQSRIKRFAEHEAKQPTGKDDLDRGQYVVTLWNTDPPVEAALMFGDFICCLRSALDHLAWELASIKGKPSRETHFPIRHDNTVEAQVAIAKATFGFPDEAIAIVRTLQPYQHGDAYKLRHLWRLHKLWNIDKHMFIALHSTAIDWRIHIDLPQPESVDRFDDRVEMRFPLSAKEKMHLYPRPMIDIQFGNDEQGIVVSFDDLLQIYQYVGTGVIPMFKSFFS